MSGELHVDRGIDGAGAAVIMVNGVCYQLVGPSVEPPDPDIEIQATFEECSDCGSSSSSGGSSGSSTYSSVSSGGGSSGGGSSGGGGGSSGGGGGSSGGGGGSSGGGGGSSGGGGGSSSSSRSSSRTLIFDLRDGKDASIQLPKELEVIDSTLKTGTWTDDQGNYCTLTQIEALGSRPVVVITSGPTLKKLADKTVADEG